MMKHHVYKTKGTCSKEISFDLDENSVVHNVRFFMGCPGNTFGIATLAEGMDAKDLIEKLKNIDCGGRGTSCPAQLSLALTEALTNDN